MNGAIDWSSQNYREVVQLPENYEVLDLTKGVVPESSALYKIGRYDELRKGLYESDIFQGDRFLHIGIDIGGPIGTQCYAFCDCEVTHFGYNPAEGDYGNVVITKQIIDGAEVWALFGHLSSESIVGKKVGQKIPAGEVIGWFGDKTENGGWEPHLHFQLSLIEPVSHDMPGVVAPEQRTQALIDFPDPRNVLGPIY
jgi:murein DD-endopeptidase MepM/ murein hydrolase activator NlpD